MDTLTAPDLTPNYPSRGAKLGPAWNEIWIRLQEAGKTDEPWLSGRELAETVAPRHNLKPTTLLAFLSRAVWHEKLLRQLRPVQLEGKPTRNHSFYRIKD